MLKNGKTEEKPRKKIEAEDWVFLPSQPRVLYQVTDAEYYNRHERWVVVTRLPRPKLSRKQLVEWLKTQKGWEYSFHSDGVRVTCDAHDIFEHGKTLSGAIRKLRKAVGVK